jgi:putative intracellular protease/amidase
MSNVLCLVASTSVLPSGAATGFWLEELAAPYARFKAAGHEVEIGSVMGGRAAPDPASLQTPFLTRDGEAFLADRAALAQLEETLPLAAVVAEDYAAVYLVGGVPAALDFDHNPLLDRLIAALVRQHKPVAAVCHGVVGLASATGVDGSLLAKGHPMTGFSRHEEELFNLLDVVAVVPEDRLRSIGAVYRCADVAFGVCVADGPLFVTGQNPASAGPAAAALIARIGQR